MKPPAHVFHAHFFGNETANPRSCPMASLFAPSKLRTRPWHEACFPFPISPSLRTGTNVSRGPAAALEDAMPWTKERLEEVARTRLGDAKLIVVANREPYLHFHDG